MPPSEPSSRPTFDPQELLTSTAVAAYASDQSGRITVWNQAAEALLGHEAKRVVGKRCFKVICGRDLFGNAQSQVFRDHRAERKRAPLQFRPPAGAPRSGC